MKKIIAFLFLSLLVFCSCGETASENAADTPALNTGTSQDKNAAAEKTSLYDSDGLSFDIPEMWQKNFKAVTRDVGSSGNTYPQTDFYYTDGERDIRLMSIGKFTQEQWEEMKKNGDVSNSLLGESGDKKYTYSIFYENHDYITDSGLRDTLSKIKAEAEKMRDKITIK